MTDQPRPGLLFQLATTPARWLGRLRTDLRVALAEDAATFGGPALRVFAVLMLIAVVYPILVSVVQASIGNGALPRAEPINVAVLPYFEDVYAESLPFMIAVAGVGAFSPALGVLLMTVFIPADLIAASYDPTSLQSLQAFGSIPAAPAARLISYALLWILAVEVPLVARTWATGWAHRRGRHTSVAIRVGATAAGTAALVFLWARALPWLIQPVFAWTPKQFTVAASNPTWTFWPILVIGAASLAAIAAAWPRPLRMSPEQVASIVPPHRPRTMLRSVLGQIVAVVVLTFLFAGLATSVLSGVILVAGLLIAGPLLTLVLPRLPVPRALANAPSTARRVTGLLVGLAMSGAMLSLLDVPEEQQNTVIVLALVVGAIAMRLVADGGAPDRSPREVQAVPTVPSSAVINTTLVVLTSVVWLLLPAVVLADNCSGWGEVGSCLSLWAESGLTLLGAALLAISFAFGKWSTRDQDDFFWRKAIKDHEREADEHVKDIMRNANPPPPPPPEPPPGDDLGTFDLSGDSSPHGHGGIGNAGNPGTNG